MRGDDEKLETVRVEHAELLANRQGFVNQKHEPFR